MARHGAALKRHPLSHGSRPSGRHWQTERRFAVKVERRRGADTTLSTIPWYGAGEAGRDFDLGAAQRLVTGQPSGGLVQVAMRVDLAAREGLVVLCDEEGLLRTDPILTAYRAWDETPLVGTLLVVSYVEDREEGEFWRPLTASEATLVTLRPLRTLPDAPALVLDGVVSADRRTGRGRR